LESSETPVLYTGRTMPKVNEIPPQSNFTLLRGTSVNLTDSDVLSHDVLLY